MSLFRAWFPSTRVDTAKFVYAVDSKQARGKVCVLGEGRALPSPHTQLPTV